MLTHLSTKLLLDDGVLEQKFVIGLRKISNFLKKKFAKYDAPNGEDVEKEVRTYVLLQAGPGSR